jgi:predicted dehydrogenase
VKAENVRVGIVGCGLIGHKRARALGPAALSACADIVEDRALSLAAGDQQILVSTDWRQVVTRDEVEVVIVATTNDQLAEVSIGALEAGKHVLVEKPAARNAIELKKVIDAAERSGKQVRVGFNHRYHPALRKAREIFERDQFGGMMFLRGRYGHGGRIGYESEWRAQPELSGGGELIDQGVHLIDLARWFLGDFAEISGFAHTYFWQMPVDDNGFMLLKTARQQIAFLHVSCTEWKNLFSLELYGRDAKLHIEGLGGSYGTERLAYYRMLPGMGPPETTIWEYPMSDTSWQLEFAEFLEDIELNRKPAASLDDAGAALDIVGKIYESSGYNFAGDKQSPELVSAT